MNNVVFESKEHKTFFLDALRKTGNTDSYHQAFFYIMGISPDTRANIRTMFDFENDEILPDGLERGWQTGGSRRLCRGRGRWDRRLVRPGCPARQHGERCQKKHHRQQQDIPDISHRTTPCPTKICARSPDDAGFYRFLPAQNLTGIGRK